MSRRGESADTTPRTIHCAICTRSSSAEALDQEFSEFPRRTARVRSGVQARGVRSIAPPPDVLRGP